MVYLLLVLGFVFLIKGADILVDGASSLAKRAGISDLVTGLTIVAFGTSMPEFFVNLKASLAGSADIAIGNVVGSNIANILLILGVAGVIYPLSVQRSTVWKEIPFSILAGLALFFLANDVLLDGLPQSIVTASDGLILLSFFSVFMYYIFEISKNGSTNLSTDTDSSEEAKPLMGIPKAVFFIVLGIVGLVYGGKWIVDGAIHMARQFDVSESVIGLTVVAVGTSLPELATSAVAAWKKNTDIAVGNVVGSNIFNIFLVLGVSAVIHPIPYNPNANADLLMVIFSSLILFAFLHIGKKHVLQKGQGAIFILLYIAYTVYLAVYRA